MTDEEKTALEAKSGEGGAPEPTELEKALVLKDAEIAKLALERDNYKKGMLKAKGKLKDDGTPEFTETDEERFDRMFQEKMLETQFEQKQKEKDEIIKKALERNKELETAIKNRTGISNSDSGTGSGTVFTPKDGVLTDEKLAMLKSKGWDDKKIEMYKKNLTRLK